MFCFVINIQVNGRVKHTNLYPDLKYIYIFVLSWFYCSNIHTIIISFTNSNYCYVSSDPKGLLGFPVRRTSIINTYVANDTWT